MTCTLLLAAAHKPWWPSQFCVFALPLHQNAQRLGVGMLGVCCLHMGMHQTLSGLVRHADRRQAGRPGSKRRLYDLSLPSRRPELLMPTQLHHSHPITHPATAAQASSGGDAKPALHLRPIAWAACLHAPGLCELKRDVLHRHKVGVDHLATRVGIDDADLREESMAGAIGRTAV